jgi:hypothetical protein
VGNGELAGVANEVGSDIGASVADGADEVVGFWEGDCRECAEGAGMLITGPPEGEVLGLAPPLLGGTGAMAEPIALATTNAATTTVTMTLADFPHPGLRSHIAHRPIGKKSRRAATTNQLC